jgi:hypothetical protein
LDLFDSKCCRVYSRIIFTNGIAVENLMEIFFDKIPFLAAFYSLFVQCIHILALNEHLDISMGVVNFVDEA